MPSYYSRLRRVSAICIGVVFCLASLRVMMRPAPAASAAFGGCPMFPADNVWNARVDGLPVDSQSDAYVSSISKIKSLHPDFGAGKYGGYDLGMAAATVPGSQPKVPITFDYSDQSDPGPYPIPDPPPIEGGNYVTNTGDRHMLIVDTTNCKLYETWNSWKLPNGSWQAGSGAVFTLTSNVLRPDVWTSSDAAGLPVLPGLARYDEASSGAITHALRFTVHCSLGHIWPARHTASYGSCATPPPMGLRFRLKTSFVISPTFSPAVRAILTALKQYGMFVADNSTSGDWFVSGLNDPNWNNDDLVSQFSAVKGSDFEAVDESGLMRDPNSGQVLVLSPMLWLPLVVR